MVDEAKVMVEIRITDIEPFRLFVWELRKLEDDMRVAASPFADRIGHALDRVTQPLDE
jgi:hypothetical protein